MSFVATKIFDINKIIIAFAMWNRRFLFKRIGKSTESHVCDTVEMFSLLWLIRVKVGIFLWKAMFTLYENDLCCSYTKICLTLRYNYINVFSFLVRYKTTIRKIIFGCEVNSSVKLRTFLWQNNWNFLKIIK